TARAADPPADRGLLERDLALVRARLGRCARELALQDRHAARRTTALPRRTRRGGRAVRAPDPASSLAPLRAEAKWLSGGRPGARPGGRGFDPRPADSSAGSSVGTTPLCAPRPQLPKSNPASKGGVRCRT